MDGNRRMLTKLPAAIVMCLLAGALAVLSPCRARADSDDEPIRYSNTPAGDPVAQLQKQLDHGEIGLTHDAKSGYLESLLKCLKVPVSSQGLVFSKTSFQRTLISPRKPRAIYFNDDTYVGFVQGGPVLELAAMDRDLGAVFYVLKQQESPRPRFVRQTSECLQCHESGMTRNVPGLLMRSVYPDLDGQPILSAGTFVSTDRSPLSQRWGGWYVTGACGRQRHMGNVICENEDHVEQTDFSAHANLTSLSKLVNTAPYLRDTSDAVALMVLAHQQQLHNLMTAASYETRIARRDNDALNKALRDPPGRRSESFQHRVTSACEPLVKAMLFCGEARLAEPVHGVSGFDREFAARGPRDSHGRSLRDFDLTGRLFRYPCSYLIYSDQFDGLPDEARQYTYRRLWEVLTGRDDSAIFANLSDEDREAILQILRETRKDLPAYWKGKLR